MSVEVWNNIHRQQTWGRWAPESIVSYFCRTFPQDRRRIRVLDLGCGAGACTRMLADEGFTVIGIDCSEQAIQHARHGLRRWGKQCGQVAGELPYCDLHVVDITARLPFDDGAFDVCLDNLTLCHVEDEPRIAATKEIRRVLKDDGSFVTRRFYEGSYEITDRGFVSYATVGSLHNEWKDGWRIAQNWSEMMNNITIYGAELKK